MTTKTPRPDSMAARLRACPDDLFWRDSKFHPTGSSPDYNGVFYWYLQSIDKERAKDVPQLPSFIRAVAVEAKSRRLA